MSASLAVSSAQPRRVARSARAIAAGFFAIVVLSLGTDQVLHLLAVYPPWGQPMHDAGLNALALAYRIIFSVMGCWITAALAPHTPMRHALILGAVAVVTSAAGTLAAMGRDLGPMWYPIALVLVSLPCAWLGGRLSSSKRGAR